MKPLKALLRIPLLVVILWIGSLTAHEVISTIRDGSFLHLGWRFLAYVCEGALEIGVLVWIYRWLQCPSVVKASPDEAANT